MHKGVKVDLNKKAKGKKSRRRDIKKYDATLSGLCLMVQQQTVKYSKAEKSEEWEISMLNFPASLRKKVFKGWKKLNKTR